MFGGKDRLLIGCSDFVSDGYGWLNMLIVSDITEWYPPQL